MRLPFAILDDNVVKNGGEVSIEVIDDTADPITYTKSTTQSENSRTIAIADDDRIRQLIVPESSGSVSEADGMASFDLMLKRVNGQQLFGVYATLTEEEGDFLLDSITNIERQYMVLFTGPDEDNIYHGMLTVPLDNDSTPESTGKIKLTINNDTNDGVIDYKIVASDQNSEVNTENIITVFDDDAPELRVSAVNSTITEADNVTANFLISAKFSPHRELEVRYNLSESQDFISLDGNGQALLDLTNGKTEARISIPIDNDSEADGTLTLTLRTDNSNPITYTPAISPNNAATVNIEAEEALPLITITGPTIPIIESAGMVNFVISATTDLGDDVTVRFDPSEVDSGNFLDETAATNQEEITSAEIDFTGSGDSYTATLPVPIHNDAIGERTGQIEVTLLSDVALNKTYRVATDGTQVARATILDDNAPELEITAGNPVTEDDNTTADFVITSQVPVTSLTVFYTPGSSDFYQPGNKANPSQTINFFGNGPYTATLPITVDNDEVLESDGSISVTLEEEGTPASTYTVKSSPSNTAEITVYDDDSPAKIWITADNGEVSESAGMAKFEISATGFTASDVTNPITIYATPTQDGSDYLPDTVPTSFPVNFTDTDGDSTYTGELSVTLDDDSDGEATAVLTLTLNADSTNSPATYQLGTATEGVITIIDDDAPILSIADGTAITEAAELMAMIPITASFASDMITIYYTPTQTGDFLGDSLVESETTSSTIDFSNGTSATLAVPIANDEATESNGSITITLVDDQNTDSNGDLAITYTIDPSADNTGTVAITDDDSLPAISIKADNGEIIEDAGPALFELTTTGLTC